MSELESQNIISKAKDSRLWLDLANANLVNGEPPQNSDNESPWFVKILLGFSGWLAAIFLLIFLGSMFSFIFEQPLGSFICGVILLVAAYFLLIRSKNDFLENLAFVFSLAGQALIFYGIFELFENNERLTLSIIIAVEIVLFILIPHFIHRLFTVSTAVSCILMLSGTFYLEFLTSSLLLICFVYLCLQEFKFPNRQDMLQACIYGLVLVLIFFYISLRYNLSGEFNLHDISNPELFAKINYWGGILFLFATVLYCVVNLLQRYNLVLHDKKSIVIILSALIFCFVGMNAHGVILSVIILLCGFSNSNKILQGLGVLSLLFFTSQYYYSLNITLLEKSKHLLILGISLLLLRWLAAYLLNNKTQTNGVSHHA